MAFFPDILNPLYVENAVCVVSNASYVNTNPSLFTLIEIGGY